MKGKKSRIIHQTKQHHWRPCPLGKFWVSTHNRRRVSSRGLASVHSVRGYCRSNQSHQDHLYRDDIEEIAERHFKQFNATPLKPLKEFKGRDAKYDSMIQGWVKYWNDIFKSEDSLDPDLVKALIGSESSFDPKKWNHLRGKKSAYGLMQVTQDSVLLLKNPKELKDHFVNLTAADMKNPNLAVCAGIRWLFRKKQLAEAKLKHKITWREAIRDFKGYSPADKKQKGMATFDRYLKELKGGKS